MIGGEFRLGFDGYTTSSIPHDATASELGLALTDMPSIDSVDVSGELSFTCQSFVPVRRRVSRCTVFSRYADIS